LREIGMLRSARSLQDYHVQATDGAVGYIEDFILDDESWGVRYLVVDTKHWFGGKRVLISSEWVEGIDRPGRMVLLTLSQKQVKDSPPYDPSQPVNRQDEIRLYDYYGRPKYWT
jgi:hypothetical protein